MSIEDADFGLEISKGVLAKFGKVLIGFIGSVIFARILGPSGYGTFYVIHTLVNVLDNPVTGWGEACKKRITEVEFPSSEALGSVLIGATILPLAVIPLVYLSQRFTGIYDLSGLLIPFSVLFITLSYFKVTNRILSARANFSAAEWADTLRSFLTTPLQLGFVLIGMGVAGMVYGLAAATALSIPYVLYKIGISPELPRRGSLSSIASYAKYSIPNGFIGTTKARIDILLLGAFISSSAVGEYQVSMQLTIAGTFIGGAAASGLMGRISAHQSQNNTSAVVNDVNNSLGYASILAIPIFFGATAMPNELIITVFGQQYGDTGLILVGLALYQVISMQSAQLSATVAGLDRPQVNTWVGILVLILNICLGYVLLIAYGSLGVVIATIISVIVQYISLSYVIKSQIPDIALFSRPLQHQLIAGVVMFICVDTLHNMIGISWWGELAMLVSTGGLIYFVVLIAISGSFRITVRGIISDIIYE